MTSSRNVKAAPAEGGKEKMSKIAIPTALVGTKGAIAAQAAKHGRSVTKEVEAILRASLGGESALDPYAQVATVVSEALSVVAGAEEGQASPGAVKLAMMREAVAAALDALGAAEVSLTDWQTEVAQDIGKGWGQAIRQAKRGPYVGLLDRLMNWGEE